MVSRSSSWDRCSLSWSSFFSSFEIIPSSFLKWSGSFSRSFWMRASCFSSARFRINKRTSCCASERVSSFFLRLVMVFCAKNRFLSRRSRMPFFLLEDGVETLVIKLRDLMNRVIIH